MCSVGQHCDQLCISVGQISVDQCGKVENMARADHLCFVQIVLLVLRRPYVTVPVIIFVVDADILFSIINTITDTAS